MRFEVPPPGSIPGPDLLPPAPAADHTPPLEASPAEPVANDAAVDITRPVSAGLPVNGVAAEAAAGADRPDITRLAPVTAEADGSTGHAGGESPAGSENAEVDDEPLPGAADGPPAPPPGGDVPVPAENPDDGRPEGQRAYEAFEARAENSPTAGDLQQIDEKGESIDWLTAPGAPPAAVAFGGEDHQAADVASAARRQGGIPTPEVQPLENIDVDRVDTIVERQLDRFSDTLTRVHEAVSATRDLAELTGAQAGRTVVQRYALPGAGYPSNSYFGRFEATLTPEGQLNVVESWPGSGAQHEAVMHETPAGEVHLVERNAERRHVLRAEEGRLVARHEDTHSVRGDDSEYFSDLNRDLTAYEDLLVEVAGHAGFSRADMTHPRGGFDRDFLLERVDPVISDPEFMSHLPQEVRVELMQRMMSQTHNLATRLNPTNRHADSIGARAYRLGNYFNTARGGRPR
jgi:hypothetical protein